MASTFEAHADTWIVSGEQGGEHGVGRFFAVRVVARTEDDAVQLVHEHWAALGLAAPPRSYVIGHAHSPSRREHHAMLLL